MAPPSPLPDKFDTRTVKRAPEQRFGVSIGGRNQVFNIDNDGAFAAAGVRMGDVLLSLDGTPIESEEWLFEKLREASADATLTVAVQRAADVAPPGAARSTATPPAPSKGWMQTLLDMVTSCGPLAKMPDNDEAPPPPPVGEAAPSATEPAAEAASAAVAVPAKIYHVVQVSVWEKAREKGVEYYPPTYEQDGFIHATHDGNLLVDVLNHFYKDVKDSFLCLELESAVLESKVIMEAPAPVGNKSAEGGPAPQAFPHIYGPIAPLKCVVRELPVERSDDGTFLRIEGL